MCLLLMQLPLVERVLNNVQSAGVCAEGNTVVTAGDAGGEGVLDGERRDLFGIVEYVDAASLSCSAESLLEPADFPVVH